MSRIIGTLVFSVFSLSMIGCGGSRKETQDSDPATLVSRNKKLNSYVYVYSKQDAEGLGRCWYSVETGKTLTSEQLVTAKATLLTPHSVEDSALADALKRSAEDNISPLLSSTSGAFGACSGAIAGAISTVTAMLVPGAQPVTPMIALTTVSSLVGCGLAGAAASDALWNAYYYSTLQKSGPKSDLAATRVGQSETSRKILLEALESTKFHSTDKVCQQ